MKKSETIHPAIMLTVTGLSHDLRGVAQVAGRSWFVPGALPGEQVMARACHERAALIEAELVDVVQPSVGRVVPRCEYAGTCGGCDVQHASHETQLDARQQVLAGQLRRIGGVVVPECLPPLVSAPWEYRRRARLACHLQVDDTGRKRLLVGLRAAASNRIVEIDRCAVLEPRLNALLPSVRALCAGWSQPRQLGHIELLSADNGIGCLVRLLSLPAEEDAQRLRDWAAQHAVSVMLRCGDDAAVAFAGNSELYCEDDAGGFRVYCAAGDFMQGNAGVNRQLIAAVLDSLQVQHGDRVLEAFCGLGNFTLPVARVAGEVLAMEVSSAMLARARSAADTQGLTNIRWQAVDLDQYQRPAASLPSPDRILLDPPRAGAQAFCEQVDLRAARRLVYVSCNPATLARDAAILQRRGFVLQSLRLVDMFPQTHHIEALAVFAPSGQQPVREAGRPATAKVGGKAGQKPLRVLGARVPKRR